MGGSKAWAQKDLNQGCVIIKLINRPTGACLPACLPD